MFRDDEEEDDDDDDDDDDDEEEELLLVLEILLEPEGEARAEVLAGPRLCKAPRIC